MSEIKPFKTLKMIKEMNLGLVKMNESKTELYGVQYYKSKWERNLGDALTIDGEKWLVGIIGDTKNGVISALNEIVKKQNSIINKKKYQQRKEEKFIMNNILNNVMKELNL
jgi:hypothetical protein